jgi:hypothetical protein
MAAGGQFMDEVRANETGGASDETIHKPKAVGDNFDATRRRIPQKVFHIRRRPDLMRSADCLQSAAGELVERAAS